MEVLLIRFSETASKCAIIPTYGRDPLRHRCLRGLTSAENGASAGCIPSPLFGGLFRTVRFLTNAVRRSRSKTPQSRMRQPWSEPVQIRTRRNLSFWAMIRGSTPVCQDSSSRLNISASSAAKIRKALCMSRRLHPRSSQPPFPSAKFGADDLHPVCVYEHALP